MRNFITVVNDSTAISTEVIGGVTYVNIKGSKFQLKKGSVAFPAAATATAPGTAGTAILTIAGSYAIGDQIRVTFTLPKSGQHFVKSFVYTVPSGGTSVNSIAAGITNLIQTYISDYGLPGVASAVNTGAGTPAALINEGVDASEIGLASYSTLLLVNKVDAAVPFIDSEGKIVQEIKYFSTPILCGNLITALT
jgi:hypothetical protein